MRRNLRTVVKVILLIACVCVVSRFILAYIRPRRQHVERNIPKHVLNNHLPPKVAKHVYKVYTASGDQRNDNVKIIQWFPPPSFITTDSFLHQVNCEKARCAVATKGTYIRHSHAIIFPDDYVDRRWIPFKKTKDKVWILFNGRPLSSKSTTNIKSVLKDRSVFNWTVSFRNDADIKISYGKIINKTAVPLYNMAAVLSRKQTTIVALQQSCKSSSHAEEYLKRLRRYVRVDVWGNCNNRTLCDAFADTSCFMKISRRYKFFLAFEEELCPDYVTDRFFRFYGTDAVAIVRGGADYTKVAPPGTYINTADFKSIEKLGKYINYLDKNDKAYVEILKRKRYYESQYSHYPLRKGKKLIGFKYFNMKNMMCDICHRLWNKNSFTKNYDDIVDWYERFQCYYPRDIK